MIFESLLILANDTDGVQSTFFYGGLSERSESELRDPRGRMFQKPPEKFLRTQIMEDGSR